MRRFSRPGKRKRRRGSITAGLSGRKLAAHHKLMLRLMFLSKQGDKRALRRLCAKLRAIQREKN